LSGDLFIASLNPFPRGKISFRVGLRGQQFFAECSEYRGSFSGFTKMPENGGIASTCWLRREKRFCCVLPRSSRGRWHKIIRRQLAPYYFAMSEDRYLPHFCWILCIASCTFSREPKAESRKYPSPLGPKPLPGVPTTWHSLSSLSKKSQLFIPSGVLSQI